MIDLGSSSFTSFTSSYCVVGELLWTLPGMCEPHSDCSKKLESGAENRCNRLICSECYSRALKKQANRIYKQISKSRLDNSDFRHIVFSPPEEWAIERMKKENSFRYLCKKATRIIKQAGIESAVLFFHPWRLTERLKSLFEEYFELKSKDIWKELVKKDTLEFSENSVKISPHFHILGAGFLKKSNIFEERTSWVYRNLGNLKYSLKNRIRYNLNHVGLALDGEGGSIFNSYTYIGDLKRRGGEYGEAEVR